MPELQKDHSSEAMLQLYGICRTTETRMYTAAAKRVRQAAGIAENSSGGIAGMYMDIGMRRPSQRTVGLYRPTLAL